MRIAGSAARTLGLTVGSAAVTAAGAVMARKVATRSPMLTSPGPGFDPLARDGKRPRILIVGGGYVGMYTALRLRARRTPDEVEIVVVDPRSYMTYQPFLPEAAAGSLEPRHVVTSLRRELSDCTIITGSLTQLRHRERTAVITPIEYGEPYEIHYDHIVLGLGSVARTLPIPGLAEAGIGFKYVEEAISLRNQVLTKMDVAASSRDLQVRARALTFVFVGAGFAGIEALGEIEDMARAATRYYDGSITRDHLRFVLVEGTGRIMPEVGEELGGYAIEQLRARGVELHLNTFLNSCEDGHVVLSDGTEFDADTLVWTAGVRANPVLADTDLPLDERGRVRTRATLQVVDEQGNVIDGAWAAGDCAAVPDLTQGEGALTGPTAQHAVRQGRHLGQNLAAVLAGSEPTDYVHQTLGTVASLGLWKGVAQLNGFGPVGAIKLRGPLAWFMHRTYHVGAMPSLDRKARIILDWTSALFFRRELVALGALQSPRRQFEAAAATS